MRNGLKLVEIKIGNHRKDNHKRTAACLLLALLLTAATVACGYAPEEGPAFYGYGSEEGPVFYGYESESGKDPDIDADGMWAAAAAGEQEEPCVVLNGNIPDFSEEDDTTESFEFYSELDELGRCGAAYANIGVDLMPVEEREPIGRIKPTGWQLVKYDFVDGKYLYNRCHLIAFQLAGENDNERNLITGTRYMNVNGMLPFENEVADYVRDTENHVLYRVTPVYRGDNLVADGVQMEARSVEDGGEGVCFNVFVYNMQPGVVIDYATGESRLAQAYPDGIAEEADAPDRDAETGEVTYVLNTNTMRFHRPDCSCVQDIRDGNRQDSSAGREELIAAGYRACKVCNP